MNVHKRVRLPGTKRSRTAIAVAMLASLAGGIWLLAPLESGAQGPPCQLAPLQPAHPLEMNTVASGDLAKTVVQEKEIYECRDPASGDVNAIFDVETFVELVERDSGTSVTTVSRRTEEATCRKDLVTGAVACGTRNIPLGSPADLPQDCSTRGLQQPSDPVEMNTVVFGPNDAVKTIKVDKELLFCPPDQIVEVFLFTEIIERRTTAGTITYRPVAKKFDGVACFKHPDQPLIQRCQRIKIGAL